LYSGRGCRMQDTGYCSVNAFEDSRVGREVRSLDSAFFSSEKPISNRGTSDPRSSQLRSSIVNRSRGYVEARAISRRVSRLAHARRELLRGNFAIGPHASMRARHRSLCANGAPRFYSLIIERRARARARVECLLIASPISKTRRPSTIRSLHVAAACRTGRRDGRMAKGRENKIKNENETPTREDVVGERRRWGGGCPTPSPDANNRRII